MFGTLTFSSFFADHRRSVLLFVLSFCVKLGLFLFLLWWFRVAGHMPDSGGHFPILGGDSDDYGRMTRNLFSQGIFSSSYVAPFIPESFRLPGYSFFLYPFFFLPHPLISAVLVQMLLASGSVVLTYLFGKKFLSEKIGFIGALLLALEPTSTLNAVSVMSDTLFVFCMLLGIYLLLTSSVSRYRFIFISIICGGLLGYTVLVRVIILYLIPCVLVLYLLFLRGQTSLGKGIVRVALVVLIGVCIVLPWSIRNHHHFGTYTISSTPYINFTQYNLVYFYAYQHHTTPSEVQHLFSDPIPYPVDSFWFRSLINEPIFLKEMHDGLSGNILPYSLFHLYKTIPFFITDSLRDLNLNIGLFPQHGNITNFTDLLLHKHFRKIFDYFLTPTPDLIMLIIGSSVWISISVLWVGAISYSIVRRKKEVWFVLLASGIIFYFAVLSSPVIQPRYRIPAAPFMLLLASYSSITLLERVQRSKSTSAQ